MGREYKDHEYKGYTIYRIDSRSDAYNPWKVSLSGRSFATLKAAKKWIDEKPSK